MRLSCNGCRVLRKGCSESCSIRPCLEWIKSPESQANATVFLAKFYGRAGLMNLINAAPDNLRPATFRSLLYEACGRIVNPIYGSVGLMWSGSWQLCQAAVEAVLKGDPIAPMPSDAAEAKNGPPLKAFDIRHVTTLSGSDDLHRARNRKRARRSRVGSPDESGNGSALSHQSEPAAERASRRSEESLASAETPEPVADRSSESEGEDGMGLDLTLGFEPIKSCVKPKSWKRGEAVDGSAGEAGLCKMELGLDFSAL
ncbi:LOB domain-containing protein 41-like [Salvia hispanica]|uniref:LOB domain-containing protein 41-like n=1 Tax=Salvia hispanica TaxID=49212 RepID=UPI00200999B7|nr:LOB domain-containing protein 41-like [Salvia hispanica]